MSIATDITRLQNAKTNIKNAIIAKGVAVDDSLTLDAYANLIAQISGGSSSESYTIGRAKDIAANLALGTEEVGTKLGKYVIYGDITRITNSGTKVDIDMYNTGKEMISVLLPESSSNKASIGDSVVVSGTITKRSAVVYQFNAEDVESLNLVHLKPMTIAEAIEYCNNIEGASSTTTVYDMSKKFIVTGYAKEAYSQSTTTDGNGNYRYNSIILKNDDGLEFTVYRPYAPSGTAIAKDDLVTVYGYLMNYRGTPEIGEGGYVLSRVTPKTIPVEVEKEITLLDALNRCSGNVRPYFAQDSIMYIIEGVGVINASGGSSPTLYNVGTNEAPIFIMSNGSYVIDEPMRIFEGTISLKPNSEIIYTGAHLFTLNGNSFDVSVKEYYQGDAQSKAIDVYNSVANEAQNNGITAPSYLGSWKHLNVSNVDDIIRWTNFDISQYGYRDALVFTNWEDNNGTSNDLVVYKSGDKYRFLTNTNSLNSLELYKYDSSTMTIEEFYPNKTYSANGSWNINTDGENRGTWTISNDSINIGSSSVNITRYYEDDQFIELRTEVSSDLGGYIRLEFDKIGDSNTIRGEIYSQSNDFISNIEGTRITQ